MMCHASGYRVMTFQLRRKLFSRRLALNGPEDMTVLGDALNLACSLGAIATSKDKIAELTRHIQENMTIAHRALGPGHHITLSLKRVYVLALVKSLLLEGPNQEKITEARAVLSDAQQMSRRVFGPRHPNTIELENTEEALAFASKCSRGLNDMPA